MGLKNDIIKLRKQKYTYNEIAEALQCAKSTVSYHCVNAGLDDQGTKLESLEPALVQQIKESLKTKTSVETAAQFNISESTVKKYKKAMVKVFKSGKVKVFKKTKTGFVAAQ